MKILLIEDNQVLTKALCIRLKSIGHTLICADSVAKAMSIVVASPPDVALIDINLPDGNGFNLAEQFFKNPNVQPSPVIFMTASNDSTYLEKARDYSPIAYLQKPFNASTLIEAIENSQYSRQCYRAHYKANYL